MSRPDPSAPGMPERTPSTPPADRPASPSASQASVRPAPSSSQDAAREGDPLLVVRGLEVRFPVRRGLFGRAQRWIHAVDGIDLTVARGETLGLVGESGCGKSSTGRAILRLIEPHAGEVRLEGTDIRKLSREELRLRRRRMQIVFQDPLSSLNPRMTAGAIVAEGLSIHALVPRRERRARVLRLFELVGLPNDAYDRYPHEFSGGQRQRIGIARALAVEPRFLVLDEPVSALDVSVQAQVVNLLEDLQTELGLGYLFIAHDMGVIRHIAHRIAVMYLGRIVEIGPGETICAAPRHPYTRLLIDSVPTLGAGKGVRAPLRGELPSPSDPPSGCPFHPRCPRVQGDCRATRPGLVAVPGSPGHFVACPHALDETSQPG